MKKPPIAVPLPEWVDNIALKADVPKIYPIPKGCQFMQFGAISTFSVGNYVVEPGDTGLFFVGEADGVTLKATEDVVVTIISWKKKE